MKELAAYLPEDAGRALARLTNARTVTELRLRADRPCRALWHGGDAEIGAPVGAEALKGVMAAMLQHSRYAWEDELGQGYFTLPDGCRVGVSGRFAHSGEAVRLTDPGSLCVRVAREVRGCARALIDGLTCEGHLESTLLLSRPGMGKTTLLRDAARLLSDGGRNVAVADERGEIAACRRGVPTMDVGARTDVADGIEKHLAIPRLIRSMGPDVLITDEIGDIRDGQAVSEAARMGVTLIASAHAGGVADAFWRGSLKDMLSEGVFCKIVWLDGRPGCISEVYDVRKGETVWRLN